MQFGLSMRITDVFFDRRRVIDATSRAERAVLSKAGAHIRTDARSSIRPRSYDSISPPGQPPFDHVGFAIARHNRKMRKQGKPTIQTSGAGVPLDQRGIRAIFFGYEPANRGVVIGPVRFGGNRGTSTIPEALEYGGVVRSYARGAGYRGKRTLNIRPHPFMRPALQRELPKFPKRWANSIRA